MKKYATFIMATLIFSSATSQALAENFYGALDVGQTMAMDTCNTNGLPAGITVTGCKDSAILFRIGGGYQFAPMWGTEVSYGSYGKACLCTINTLGNGSLALGDWWLSGIEISGTVTFPVGDELSLIGKIGIAQTDLKLTSLSLSATSTNLAFGFGAQYAFNNRIAIRAQYENLGIVGNDIIGSTRVKLLTAGIVSMF